MSTRLMRSAAAPAVALLLLASGAPSAATNPSSESTNGQSAPTSQKPQNPLGSADSNGENKDIPNASAEIVSLQRSTSGLISVTIKVTNNGDQDIHDNAFGNTVFRYREDLFSGVTLLDESGQSRFNPIMDEEGYCSCSGYAPRAPYAPFVRPGESIDYWAMYSLPDDISSVDVEIPGFDPIKNVPVG